MTAGLIRNPDTGRSDDGLLRFTSLERAWRVPDFAETAGPPLVRQQGPHAGLQRLTRGARPRRSSEPSRHQHAAQACHLGAPDDCLCARTMRAAHPDHRRRHPRLRLQREERRPSVEGWGTVRDGLHPTDHRE
jgi:hypothetical protein